jgi:hypothetical protein
MPAIRTIVKPPLSNTMTVRVPDEYRSYSLEVIIMPIMENDFNNVPHAPLDGERKSAKRKIGGFEKGFYMAPDFDAPLKEFAEYM